MRRSFRPRAILTIALLVAAGGASYAFAASLGVGSHAVGAGVTTVPLCDTDGFSYVRQLSPAAGHPVTSVTVNDIAAACAGGTLQLTLADAADASLGSGSAAVTGSGSATVTITGSAPAASVTAYRAAITN